MLDNSFSHKLISRWDGPFTILETFGPVVVLSMDSNGTQKRVSKHRVKRYVRPLNQNQGVESDEVEENLPGSDKTSKTDQNSNKNEQKLRKRNHLQQLRDKNDELFEPVVCFKRPRLKTSGDRMVREDGASENLTKLDEKNTTGDEICAQNMEIDDEIDQENANSNCQDHLRHAREAQEPSETLSLCKGDKSKPKQYETNSKTDEIKSKKEKTQEKTSDERWKTANDHSDKQAREFDEVQSEVKSLRLRRILLNHPVFVIPVGCKPDVNNKTMVLCTKDPIMITSDCRGLEESFKMLTFEEYLRKVREE
jgi:hypothetical protein